MKKILQKYIACYPRLAALSERDIQKFAQKAMRLAIPPGVTGDEILELSKMAAPKRGGWRNRASAENGKKGGRPRKISE